MKILISFLFIFSLHIGMYAQKKFNTPVEVSIFYSFAVSYSHLSSDIDPRMSSQPSLNALNYGIKMERKILRNKPSLFLNISLFGMDLSVNGKSKFHDYDIKKGVNGSVHSKWIVPHYNVYSLGLKKVFNSKKKQLIKFYIESGIRFLHRKNNVNPSDSSIVKIGNDFIFRNFTFNNQKNNNFIPFISSGFDINYKKIKIGFQLWMQKGFTKIYEYNYTVKYKDVNFNSTAYTKGFSWGFFVNVKVFSF